MAKNDSALAAEQLEQPNAANGANGFMQGKDVGEHKSRPKRSSKRSGGALLQMSKLRLASKRALPSQYGDGTYLVVKTRPGLGKELKALRMADIKTLVDLVRNKLKGEKTVDDKTMIMERVIQLVAALPHNSRAREGLTTSLIADLWNSLEHPPMLLVGDLFRFRSADGSNNNVVYPSLGAAGSTYARSCRPRLMTLGAMPDPGLIFDSVMARSEYRKHPNNVSSILWYWATIIIHDIFWTDFKDTSKNKTSSYLDLSPLYGSNQDMQDTIRTFKDGRLKADSFADKRLIGMPPGVCVLLVMFNRFHNHVAENLAAINEGDRFTKPRAELSDEDAAKAWKKYDNDLFQTARLVTSGLYINIILVDYVRNIVNLNRSNTTWTLDPRQEAGIDVGTGTGAESGTGNLVSAEFNLCYRWHSCISDKDDKWIQELYGKLLGGKQGPLTTADMMRAFSQFERSIPDDPIQRTFGGFTRGKNEAFRDDDLAECITSAIEDCAGAFGGRNVPKVMRPVEILGILQARKWNVCGLNEFRQHFGLKPYDRFEDINPDPRVADQLRHLYEHPDFVELYPGLVAEDAKKPMVPGVGIAPTYTISRVVLSDAVCLVRGDRHYTTDYHPRNLTNWGYNEVQYDMDVNQGCCFSKLFLQAFPHHFKSNSVYAHYPMVIPSENLKILTDLGRVEQFDFTRPALASLHINITSYAGARHILEHQDKYRVIWNDGLSMMGSGGSSFLMFGDTNLHTGQKRCMQDSLNKEVWHDHIKSFYASTTEELLNEKSYKLAGQTRIDIVRDVGNIAHVHFASRVFNLPLKTKKNPKGIHTEQELYSVLAAIFTSVFFDIDPTKSFPLRQAAKTASTQLGKLVEMNVKLTSSLGVRGLFTGSAEKKDPLSLYGANMIKDLVKSGLSPSEIAWSQIIPTASAVVPSQAELFAQAVDFYLSRPGQCHIGDIRRIALQPASPESDTLLLGYAMEGIRLAGTFLSYRKATSDDVLYEQDGREVPVCAGDHVFVSGSSATKDPHHFPSPDKVDPRRPIDAYVHYDLGPQACLGREASQIALTEMFRVVFRRKNLRRVPGPQGELKKVPQPGGFFMYMREDWGALSPFPTSLKVMWDDE